MSNEIKLIFILISFCYSQCDSNNDEELDIHDIIITVDCILSDCWSNDIIIDEVAFNDHVYQTVIIGDQTWFAEDLQSYHYANGDQITNLAWITLMVNILRVILIIMVIFYTTIMQ